MSKDTLDGFLDGPAFNSRRYQEELATVVHRCLVDGSRLMGRWCPRCRAQVVDDYGDWLVPDPKGAA